ncbi:MAG: PHP domain-containing protein [Pirellula sp.]
MKNPKPNIDKPEPIEGGRGVRGVFMRQSHWLIGCFFAVCFASQIHAEDGLDRLKLDRLEKQHDAIAELRSKRTEPRVERPYQDYRANLHVHSAFSHDSRGKIEQIVAAAKAAGSQVILFTEHPATHYDFLTDGHQGIRDGVLLVPGAEMKGFLVFPKHNVQAFAGADKQEFSNIVRGRGGLTFVSHLEERMDWQIHGATGCEIYNTHADFKDESRLIASLKNPLWLIQAKKLFDRYPQESFSALMDYPADYLRRWDELCLIHPHSGVSANDAHQNVGLVVRLIDGGKVQVEDPLGEKILELDRSIFAAIQEIPPSTPVGTELFRMQIDPYENSLRHVGTHLLMKELSVDATWESLNSGRAFVAFDWLADSTGFDFVAMQSEGRIEMGSQADWKPNTKFRAVATHSVQWRLKRNGKSIYETTGLALTHDVAEPGVYRVEAWLNVADREHAWILSNPIYLR